MLVLYLQLIELFGWALACLSLLLLLFVGLVVADVEVFVLEWREDRILGGAAHQVALRAELTAVGREVGAYLVGCFVHRVRVVFLLVEDVGVYIFTEQLFASKTEICAQLLGAMPA